PILEREVLNAMTLHVGGAYREKSLPDQEAAIERIFINEGYVAPRVTVSPGADAGDGHLTLNVKIDKGAYYRVKKVEIKGSRSFLDARLKLRINVWKSSMLFREMKRFIKKEMDEDIKNLTGFYREKQHPEAVVTREVKKDEETHDVFIQIIIDEGPLYDIEFEGNEYFWDWTLKKDLILFSRGNKSDLGIRASIRNMRERYRNAGFLNARIKMESRLEEEDDGGAVRYIKLIIEEGPQSIVDSVTIRGDQGVAPKEIKKQMLTRPPGILSDGGFVPKILEEDMGAVESLYETHGYRGAVAEDRIQWREDEENNKRFAEVTLDIREGVQTRVSSVTFQGLNSLAADKALKTIGLKKGGIFREAVIREDEMALSSLISEQGHPYVEVKGSAEFSEDGREAAVTYLVNEGPDVEMGRVHVAGNFRTKARIIENEMELSPGDPFSLEKLLASQRNTRNINALSAPHFKTFGLKEKMERVDLLVEVEEKKPYFFQAAVGYDTERELYTSVGVGDRNLFGANKDGRMEINLSQTGYSGELQLTEPRFLGTRIKSNFRLYAEELEELNKGYRDQVFGAALLFKRAFREKFKAGLSFSMEHRRQIELDSDSVSMEEMDRYDPRVVFVVSPALSYSTVDSVLLPTRGESLTLSVDISKGLDDARDDFLKYHLEARKYYTPMDGATLAARGRVGWITPYGSSDEVFDDQLFFLGGVSTVRGFKYNMLLQKADGDAAGGKEEVLGNLEARIDLGLNVQLITFFDIGTVGASDDAVTPEELRYSAGLGLGYVTPVGAISVFYGHKLNRRSGEGAGRYHFAVGFTF
ncbi:MAG: outer membrane protein assembly factor BamA, partial [Desulfobacterales bacterium]|nr:outer membrane protein assembly factor BamA [Desulfobacterales bacterium]